MKALRVLHCPTMVGLNPQSLARAERALGLESWSVSFEPCSLCGGDADEVLWTPGSSLGALFVRWLRLLRRAARDFDVIHYNAGESLVPRYNVRHTKVGALSSPPAIGGLIRLVLRLLELRDVAWLKRQGKAIVVTFQGDDARQHDFCRAHFDIHFADEVEAEYSPPAADAQKRRRILLFDRYADRIYGLNPDLLHVLPRRTQFLPYANVDIRDWIPVPKPCSEVPVVLHAPTHQGVKGTRFVKEAIGRLQGEGVRVDLLLVENTPRPEARRSFERADLLVDQVLAGWYGGLAVEMMALARPVMCYIRPGDLKFIPEAMRQDLPIINVRPDTLYDSLKEWLTVRRHELPALGARSRAYVEKWHDPMKIAAHLKKEYESLISA